MDNFFAHMFRRETPVPESLTPEKTADQPPQARSGNYGKRIVSVRGQKAALSIAAFHRALEIRATTMGQLIMEYQRRSAVGGNFVPFLHGPAAKLNWLLQVRPNPLMSATVLMQQAEIERVMRGNAYIYIERDSSSGEVKYLWLAQSGGYDHASDTYALSYNVPGGVANVTAAPASDVIHIPNTFRHPGGLQGIPTLVYAERTLSIAATNDVETLNNASKGGKMKILLQEDKEKGFGVGGRAKASEIRKAARTLQDDLDQGDDVISVNNVLQASVISQNAEQMQLIEQRGFSVAEIARLMGVPKPLLMDDSNSSYKTPEAALQSFMTYTIQPAIGLWEDELNAKLLTIDDFGKRRIHLCERNLRRLDPSAQAALDKLHLETGVCSVNELRAAHDMPTVEGGDAHYVSTNLAEVGSEKLRAATSGNNPAGQNTSGQSGDPGKSGQSSTTDDNQEGGDA